MRTATYLLPITCTNCGGDLELVNERVAQSQKGVGTELVAVLTCPRHGDLVVEAFIRSGRTTPLHVLRRPNGHSRRQEFNR